MKARFGLAMIATLICCAAFAHSTKEETTPKNGALLSEPPETIQMIFNDPLRFTLVRLVDADGSELPLERSTGLEPSREFNAVPAALAPGSYTVEWRGLALDGHAMKGSFSFEVAD